MRRWLVFPITILFALSFITPLASADEINFITLTSTWLDTLNYYRTSSGLPPVLEDSKITSDVKAHTDYLAKTDPSLFTGQFVSRHTENPKSPFYAGRGLGSNVASSLDSEPSGFIDQWMQAPFHAAAMLSEGFQSTGLGISFNEYTNYYDAALDISQGMKNVPRTKNIFYPANDAYTRMNAFMGENPDPRESCGDDWKSYKGLPVFVSLLNNPPLKISATISEPSGKIFNSEKNLCIVNEYNFKSSDVIYGSAGKSIIDGYNMVIIIAKEALESGKNSVVLKLDGQSDITWSFNIIAPPEDVKASFDNENLAFKWSAPEVAAPNKVVGYEVIINESGFKNIKKYKVTSTEFDAWSLNDGNYFYCVRAIGKYRSGDCPLYWSFTIDHLVRENTVNIYYPYAINSNTNLFLVKSRISIQFQLESMTEFKTSTPKICSLTRTSYSIEVTGRAVGTCAVDISSPGTRRLKSVQKHYDFQVQQLTSLTCKKGNKTLIVSGYPAKCPAGYKPK